MKHEGMAGANLLWLADALAVDGPALARMDISIEEDVALCEQTLRLIGKACPAATRYAGESLETFLQEKISEKTSGVPKKRHEDNTALLLCSLLELAALLSGTDRQTVVQLIGFVEKWPEQYLWNPTEPVNDGSEKRRPITYKELKQRQQAEVSAFPMAFAFGARQFEEGMKKLGLEPSEREKIVSIGGGGFIRKDDQEALMEMFRQHKRQRKIAAAADKTGNGYLLEMFRYELANHEYGYTRDPEPALDALGLTEQEIAGDKRLCAAYLTARRQEAA